MKDSAHLEMLFWDHLEIMRKMIFRIAIVVVALMIAIFFAKKIVFETIIFSPTTSNFCLYKWLCKLGTILNIPDFFSEPFHINIININLASQFFTHINTSFWIV